MLLSRFPLPLPFPHVHSTPHPWLLAQLLVERVYTRHVAHIESRRQAAKREAASHDAGATTAAVTASSTPLAPSGPAAPAAPAAAAAGSQLGSPRPDLCVEGVALALIGHLRDDGGAPEAGGQLSRAVALADKLLRRLLAVSVDAGG
eukprot:5647-Chlamydomonas_euryale.AAC.1